MLPNNVIAWLMGIFAASIIGLGAWAGSSLSALPVLAFRVQSLEVQIATLVRDSAQGARFTAQDGVNLADFVRDLEARIVAVENRLPGPRRAKGDDG